MKPIHQNAKLISTEETNEWSAQTRESRSKTWAAGTCLDETLLPRRNSAWGIQSVLFLTGRTQGQDHFSSHPQTSFTFAPGTYTCKNRVPISLIMYSDRLLIFLIMRFQNKTALTKRSPGDGKPSSADLGLTLHLFNGPALSVVIKQKAL